MNIIFILSLTCLITLFILMKKTEKKIDILSFIGITAVITMCYNVFLAFILTFFKIPFTLLNLSVINFIISAIFVVITIKNKEIQKYEINKIDIICISLIAIGVGIVSYLEFGFPFNIKYETSDPSEHYLTSLEFAKEDSLLINYNDIIYGNLGTRKPGSYVNSGLIMKVFSPYMEEIYFYNIFIVYGILVLFLTGTVMYNTLVKFSKNNKTRIMAGIVSIIYVLGYPLNSFLFGFEYMNLAILVISTIIEMIFYFENKELNFTYNVIIFFLLNFGLFFSYYTFIPFVYSALWIYFCIYSYKKNNKIKDIISKNNIIMLLVTLLLPFAFGYIYHMAPQIYKLLNANIITEEAKYISGSAFSRNGYIFISFYSNIILLIPLTIYSLWKENKAKNFDFILLLFLILYIELFIIGFIFRKVSAYYICKNYYVLWMILIYENYKGLMYLYEKKKIYPYILVIIYIILIVTGLIFKKVERIESNTNENESLLGVTDIYGYNKTIINETITIYTTKEIEILKYVKDNLDYNKEIEILGNRHQVLWGYPILRYVNYDENLDKIEDEDNLAQARLMKKHSDIIEKIGKVDYLIYFKKSIYYKLLNEKMNLLENGEIIYENDAGGIIKYTKP